MKICFKTSLSQALHSLGLGKIIIKHLSERKEDVSETGPDEVTGHFIINSIGIGQTNGTTYIHVKEIDDDF